MVENSNISHEAEFDMLVAEVHRGDEELQHSRDVNQLLLEQNRLLRERLERLEMEQSTIIFPPVRERQRTQTGSVSDDGVSANAQTRGERPISPSLEQQRGPSVFTRDKFDGKSPWNEYIGHFEACRMANDWDDTQAKVFLVASLRGPALKTLGGKTSDSSGLSYHELVRLLEKRFGPGQLAENYLLELRYRRQGPRATIQELGQAIRELSMLAYPELPEESQDRLARTHFMEAIEDHSVREGVFRSKPISLDEAIQVALGTDNFYRLEEQRTGRRYKQSRVLEGNSSTEVDELRQELKRIREMLECDALRPFKSRGCICKTEGHHIPTIQTSSHNES